MQFHSHVLLVPGFNYGHPLLHWGFQFVYLLSLPGPTLSFLPYIRHAQCRPICLSNVLVFWASVCLVVFVFSFQPLMFWSQLGLSFLPASHLPWPQLVSHVLFCPCHLFSAYMGCLHIINWPYLGEKTWFQLAACSSMLFLALVKKQAGAQAPFTTERSESQTESQRFCSLF